jgi:hypothetical protein
MNKQLYRITGAIAQWAGIFLLFRGQEPKGHFIFIVGLLFTLLGKEQE